MSLIYPSDHLLPLHLEVGLQGQKSQQRCEDLPGYFFKLIQQDTKTIPGQLRDVDTQSSPGSSLDSLLGGTCPEHLSRDVSRRYRDRC